MITQLRSHHLKPQFNVDCGYLQAADAFESNQLVSEWPAAENVFLAQRVRSVRPGSELALPVLDFVSVMGQIGLNLPDGIAAELELKFAKSTSGLTVTARYVANHSETVPPIEADNPGFFAYALNWFADRRPRVRVYIMRGLFWVISEHA